MMQEIRNISQKTASLVKVTCVHIEAEYIFTKLKKWPNALNKQIVELHLCLGFTSFMTHQTIAPVYYMLSFSGIYFLHFFFLYHEGSPIHPYINHQSYTASFPPSCLVHFSLVLYI